MKLIDYINEGNQYWDRDGLFKGNNLDSYPSTNNGVQLTGLYYLLLLIFTKNPKVFKEEFKDRLLPHQHELFPGLFHERKGTDGGISYDDLISLSTAAGIYCPEIAFNILMYGMKHGFKYDNLNAGNPKFRTDVSRFLVTPFLFLNAGMKPSVLDKFLITLLILGKLLLSRGTSGKQNILILTFGIRVRPQLSAYLNFLVWIFDRYVDPVKLMKTYHGENHLFTRTIQHLKQLKYKIN